MKTEKLRLLILIGVALVMECCGGSGGGGSGGEEIGDGGRSLCTATLSGAVTGTFDCSPAAAFFSPDNNTTTLWLGFANATAPPGNVEVIQFGLEVAGRQQMITYTPANVRSGQAVVNVNSAPDLTWYEASTGLGTGSSLRMVISGFEPWPPSSQVTFNIHGTADATLPYQSGPGARANVTLHAVF